MASKEFLSLFARSPEKSFSHVKTVSVWRFRNS